MSSGLLALLDDVAAIAKVAAAKLDDVAAQSAKAGAKAAGIVIDDAAVTPRYVVGFAADRELPIVGRIAWGSLKNKLILLMPGALALSFFAPWLIPPLLVVGGLFLCFEGYEKVHDLFAGHAKAEPEAQGPMSPEETRADEDRKIRSAIKTDVILSAEIMALTLAVVPDRPLWEQAMVLLVVGLGTTIAVYGAVALIVKADDLGVALAQRTGKGALDGMLRAFGRGLVLAMPPFLQFLSIVGMLAMLWVGGGIVVHSLEVMGYPQIAHALHGASAAITGPFGGGIKSFAVWLVEATGAGVLGLALGAVVALIVAPLSRLMR